MGNVSMLKAKVRSTVDAPIGQTGMEALAILLITQGYNMVANGADINTQILGVVLAGLGVACMFLKYLARANVQ